MSWITKIRERASLWIDHAATAMLAWREALRPPRFARLVEQDDGSFALQDVSAPPDRASKRNSQEKPAADAPRTPFRIADGAVAPVDAARLAPLLSRARVEIVLRQERFLFRPLQLPRRAADFLEAIIRSQIDRLTPWSPAEAAFGFLPEPPGGASEQMQVTVAATARTLLSPFVNAARGLGVEAVSISTPAPDGGAATIKVLEQKIEGAVEAQRLRRGLTLLIGALTVLAIASVALASIAGGELEARRDEIDHRITERRAALHRGGDANSAAALALERKKHETPSSVLVYEELSRILPDDAYLTELRIQGDKAQIVGIARDAPELIHLIEQSPHFKAATFFAPTTHAPTESGQHFFIEAHIQPVFPEVAPHKVLGQ
jgi:general secretion pathway protein L